MSEEEWRAFTPKVIDENKCFARTWAGGQGGQCIKHPTKPEEDPRLCSKHYASNQHGEVDGPIPVAKLAEFQKFAMNCAKRLGHTWGIESETANGQDHDRGQGQCGAKRKRHSGRGKSRTQKNAPESKHKSSSSTASSDSSGSSSSSSSSRAEKPTGAAAALKRDSTRDIGILVRPSKVEELVKLMANFPLEDVAAKLSSISALEQLTEAETKGINSFVRAGGIKFVSLWLSTSLSSSGQPGQAQLMLRLLQWLKGAHLTREHLKGTSLPHVIKRVKENSKIASNAATQVLTAWTQAFLQDAPSKKEHSNLQHRMVANVSACDKAETTQASQTQSVPTVPPCDSSSKTLSNTSSSASTVTSESNIYTPFPLSRPGTGVLKAARSAIPALPAGTQAQAKAATKASSADMEVIVLDGADEYDELLRAIDELGGIMDAATDPKSLAPDPVGRQPAGPSSVTISL